MKQFRQGDIFLKEILSLPPLEENIIFSSENNILNKNIKEGEIILAYGESTGHKHAFYNQNAFLFKEKNGNRFFLIVKNESHLEHEEHDTIILPIGNYEVIRQREYTPKEIRRVTD